MFLHNRTNFAKEIAALLRDTYGGNIKVLSSEIPHSVRAKESSAEGRSILVHGPGGKVAAAYKNLTEVMKIEKQHEKSRAGIGRLSFLHREKPPGRCAGKEDGHPHHKTLQRNF